MLSVTKSLLPVALLALLTGCGGGPGGLTGDTVKYEIEKNPIKLEAEQVSLTQKQFECGLKEELWELAPEKFGERTVARLTPRARDLKFDDEVTVSEPGFKLPYVQVRGQLPVQMIEFVSAKERTQDIWDATAKLGVVIQHACFPTPLPLLGVKKGKFTQDTPPVFQFRHKGEEWRALQLVH